LETAIQVTARTRIRPEVISVWGLLGVTLAYGAGNWIYSIFKYIDYPQIEYTEGFLFYNARLFAAGQWLWNVSSGPPYATSFYPPVYYLLYSGLFKIFGESWIAGRLLVLVCALVGMFFVYKIVYHITRNKLTAIIGGLLPLTQPLFIGWSFTSRVDVPAATFEIIGVYLFLRYWNTKWIWLSALVFIITFFTKQSIIAGVIGCTLYLLIKDWRRGLKYAGMILVPVILILIVGSLLTGWQFFKQLFLFQRTLPTYKPSSQIISLIIVTYMPLIPLIVLAIKRFIQHKLDIISIYFVVAFVINLVMLGREGGSTNYAVQIVFAICTAGALLLDSVLIQRVSKVLLCFGFSLFFLVGQVGFMPIPDDTNYLNRYSEVKAVIADANYPILTENAGVVLDSGKVPYYEPFSFTQLSNFSYWDNSRLIADLNSQRIPYVITEKSVEITESMRYSIPVQEAILANYRVIYADGDPFSNFRMVVYKPIGR
jgi:hypothetical protein